MCNHTPTCPAADAVDHLAAKCVRRDDGIGCSTLCNGVCVFDDDTELVIDPPADEKPKKLSDLMLDSVLCRLRTDDPTLNLTDEFDRISEQVRREVEADARVRNAADRKKRRRENLKDLAWSTLWAAIVMILWYSTAYSFALALTAK